MYLVNESVALRIYIKRVHFIFGPMMWNDQKYHCQACLRSNVLLLCPDNFSNQVDEDACGVNWERAGAATSVKLYSRCIRAQWACFSVRVGRDFDERGDSDVKDSIYLTDVSLYVTIRDFKTCQVM